MKIVQGLAISLILVACSPSFALSASDLELFGEACNSLKSPEKRKACQVALTRLDVETKANPEVKKAARAGLTQVPITFKDIPIGQAGVKAALTEMCSRTKYVDISGCKYNGRRLSFFVTFGNLVDSLTTFELGEGDSLASIEIKESKSGILNLAEALQDKYGAPEKTTSFVENKLGTKFERQVFVWIDAQGNRIRVESIYEKIDEGRVVIESAAKVALLDAVGDALKGAAKSNL